MHIGIVTDSLSNLPKDIAKDYGIYIVNGSVYVDNKRYISETEISTEQILEIIKTKNVKTAVPSPGDYYELYEKLLDQYDHIISIHSPSKVTGFITSAKSGAKRTKNPEKIIIIECGVTTIGLGLVALATAILARETTNLEILINEIKELSTKIEVLGVVGSFKYLRRSGRVKLKVAGELASIISIKPVVELKNSKISLLEKPRDRKKAFEKLEKRFLNRFDPTVRPKMIGISQLQSEDEENTFKTLINKEYPDHEVIEANIDPMIACNTGPGLFLISYFSN